MLKVDALGPTFVKTEIVFRNAPGRPAGLNEAVIVPDLPGNMGSLVQLGVVQPQEA